MHSGTPSADGIREGTSSTILHRKPYRGEHHRSHPRPSIRQMTATFPGVNINLHGFLDFARAENENPTGPDIQIVLGRPLDIASQNPVYVNFWGSLRLAPLTAQALPQCTKRNPLSEMAGTGCVAEVNTDHRV